MLGVLCYICCGLLRHAMHAVLCMPCYSLPCHAVPCSVLCYAMPYYGLCMPCLFHAMLCHAMPCHALCFAMLRLPTIPFPPVVPTANPPPPPPRRGTPDISFSMPRPTRSCTQDAKAGTIPAEPLMQALLEQYLKRVSVNRATLKALFTAGDTDSDGLLDRPQAKAALLCAQPSLSDTVLTTIWLEREKVWLVSRAGFNEGIGVDGLLGLW